MKMRMFVVCVAAITMSLMWSESTSAAGVAQGPQAVEKWFEQLPNAKEKMTKLRFFFHDTVTGDNPTGVQVGQPRNSPLDFGSLSVIDAPLRVGAEAESKVMGRAQGIYSSVSREGGTGLLMSLNYIFTDGIYNGSSLSVLAHNAISNQYREFPILGGSGYFRLARGIATVQTNSFNATTLNAVMEYNVVVLHY